MLMIFTHCWRAAVTDGSTAPELLPLLPPLLELPDPPPLLLDPPSAPPEEPLLVPPSWPDPTGADEPELHAAAAARSIAQRVLSPTRQLYAGYTVHTAASGPRETR
jgi:hypothetical protein